MTPGVAVALTGAVLATAWAALLALADGALAADPALAETALSGAYAEKPERFRRALALGRIVFLALAAVGASGALAWWHTGTAFAALASAVVVIAVAALGDLGPRALGLWRGPRLGPGAVRTAAASLDVIVPLIVAAGILDRALGRLFGVAGGGKAAAPDPAQRDMLLGVFALADTMVSEIMTPRVDLTGVDCARSFEETVATVAAAEHARLPAFDRDLDHTVGVLYAKDLLPALFGADPEARRTWRSLVRPVDIVPETKTLDAQLRDFQRGPGHLAVVVDEYGGTAGIVTLEDVLEEIVGEIRDEYDATEVGHVSGQPDGTWMVDGRTPLDELSAALGTPFAHEEVTTAGGLAYSALGHVPVAGERLELHGWRVTVDLVVRRSIRRLRFERAAG
ncbi:MAG TPA: hemolysin family protein [Gemmatimonadales bacterium]|nr:hemolysin family protein [Gemmatimonadales bacterium]